MVSSLLVIYLAAELGAAGIAVSLILAAPRFAGLLRLGVPALTGYLEGIWALLAVPLAAWTLLWLLLRAAADCARGAKRHSDDRGGA